jgi:hypothetical protein
MNPDTERKVQEIRGRGWYKEGTAMGDGGWQEVHKFADDWPKYIINIPYTPYIMARDDETAAQAFRSLFNIPHGTEMMEKIVTYRKCEL